MSARRCQPGGRSPGIAVSPYAGLELEDVERELVAMARRIGGPTADPWLLDELVQAGRLEAVQACETWREGQGRSRWSWMRYRVTFRMVRARGYGIRSRRGLDGAEPLEELAALVEDPAASGRQDARDQLADVARARLRPSERRLLALLADGRTHAEIGELLQAPRATITRRIKRLRRKLRAQAGD